MAKATKARSGISVGPPDPGNYVAFRGWLQDQPREWSVTIAARAALRVLPLIDDTADFSAPVLAVFRAAAIARFAAKYPKRSIDPSAAAHAADAAAAAARTLGPAARVAAAAADAAATSAYTTYAAAAAADVADAVDAASTSAAYAAADAAMASAARAGATDACITAIRHDARRMNGKVRLAEQLAREPLWPIPAPAAYGDAWQLLSIALRALGGHWSVWIDWYEKAVLNEPHRGIAEAEDAAYTDLPGLLRWHDGAETVNTEIARRLAELRGSKSSQIPDQSPAPVRVEERGGRVSKATDHDGALSTTERDFRAWRDPVVDHIDELTASDFAAGTNHSRIRDRLMALGKLLPGEIAEVKDRQFRIGYEIERFEGLMAAYRSGDEDMPMLNAAQLEDLDRLRVALKMGIDKLERWSEFRKQANESTAGEADADREAVGDALDEMAAVMERHAKYFDPELPATFRFLSEAVRDPRGATRTIVYGAIKSAENVVSFLGQRALGIGKKGAEAVETHISKAVAASLVAGLSGAALAFSGALSQGWAWLKPLLAALGTG